jgi:hypothetical protein
MADKALLVGINNYAHVSDLRGCVNDVLSMHNTLTELYGFEDSQFRELLDEEATKRQIEDGFRWLLDGAQLGDRLVFHFSGHGSFVESTDSDEAVDELICLQNMNWDDPDSYLVDDQLGVLLEGVPPGVRLTVVLDSCFSGTGTRAIQPQRRAKGALVIDADTQLQANCRELRGLERRASRADDVLTAYRNEPERLVLARFVEPRPRYQELRTTHKVMRLGRSLKRTTTNHQLLSAASDQRQRVGPRAFHGAPQLLSEHRGLAYGWHCHMGFIVRQRHFVPGVACHGGCLTLSGTDLHNPDTYTSTADSNTGHNHTIYTVSGG